MPDRYVLDANCFIEPHKRFYPFDIAPGYWKALKTLHKAKSICSIDRVKDELLALKDQLSDWVKGLHASFFKQTRDQAVISEYSNMMQWVQENNQFTDAAKRKFACKADAWLVAFAKVTNRIVVTQEKYS